MDHSCSGRFYTSAIMALSYDTSAFARYTATVPRSGGLPLKPPPASPAFLDYLTSILPSDSSAYKPLDTPCPGAAFETAFASIRTDECPYDIIDKPTDRINCMCDTYQSDMIATITSMKPTLCGSSGPLAALAIASATQAVLDVCSNRPGYGGAPVTYKTERIPSSYPTFLYPTTSASRTTMAYPTTYPYIPSSAYIPVPTEAGPCVNPRCMRNPPRVDPRKARIGIAVGIVVLLALLTGLVVMLRILKHRRRKKTLELGFHEPMHPETVMASAPDNYAEDKTVIVKATSGDESLADSTSMDDDDAQRICPRTTETRPPTYMSRPPSDEEHR